MKPRVKRVMRTCLGAALMTLALAFPKPVPADNQTCEQCLGGGLDAPIRIEVFSDFECPACKALYMETMRQVLKDYCAPDKVCVIYREFPLPMHKYSRVAARYSMAAQKLGRQQWLAVVESLYEDQAVWSQNGLVNVSVARALSPIDYQKVQKLIDDPAINQSIDRDIAMGHQREIQSTPTFFVTALGREQKVVGGLPYNVLKDFFDKIIK
jgi:protein-disulfide isomerase